jgi:tetracycline 7-halogenase / FADH2 O2-dependent halogenase
MDAHPLPDPNDSHYDVAILGTRMGGLILAAILARHNARVVVLDDDIMPRHQSGEATIPYSSMLFELIADRYDLPEIRAIARADELAEKVMPSSGIKKNLGFLYHGEGQPQDPGQSLQFNVPSEHGESHLFRQDIDSWLLHGAIRRGAVYRPRRRDGTIAFDADRVRIQDGYGEWLSADFVIDASGPGSPLADRFGLRQFPGPLTARSTLFTTHMIGVKPYDDCAPHALAGHWHAGTLHHVFAGGWLGIIPFDNHAVSTNPLCSVVISLTGDAPAGMDGDAVLADLIRRFPSLAPHLGPARRVREWDVRQPAQYAASAAFGDRFLLLDDTAWNNDLLFSRALSNTAELVQALAHRLLAAVRAKDYTLPALRDFEKIQRGVALLNDRILAAAQTAFRDPNLWNAFARVWLMQSIACTVTTRKVHDAFVKSGDPAVFESIDQVAEDGFWMPLFDGYKQVLNLALGACEGVRDGALTASQAADSIFKALSGLTCLPPIFDFADPEARVYQLTTLRKIKTLWWGLTMAPGGVGSLIFYRSFRKPAAAPPAFKQMESPSPLEQGASK